MKCCDSERINLSLGNYDTATNIADKRECFLDSIQSVRTQKGIILAAFKYDAETKEKKLNIAHKRIEEQQRMSVYQTYGLIMFGIIIISIIWFSYRLRKKNVQIEDKNKQLEELNLAKNYLFSVISHDLRSPISSLLRQQNKLKTAINQTNNPVAESVIDANISITNSIQHLLNNVLHWSLEQSDQIFFNPQIIVAKPILEQVLFDFREIAKAKNINIITNFEGGLRINVDRESFKIILRNLIDNALKYTSDNGLLTIISYSNLSHVYIEIKDTGKGMSKGQLKGIRSLQSLNVDKIDRSQGIGLGLLLCTTLIKKNKANLEIESESNKGSVFRIVFPMLDS